MVSGESFMESNAHKGEIHVNESPDQAFRNWSASTSVNLRYWTIIKSSVKNCEMFGEGECVPLYPKKKEWTMFLFFSCTRYFSLLIEM